MKNSRKPFEFLPRTKWQLTPVPSHHFIASLPHTHTHTLYIYICIYNILKYTNIDDHKESSTKRPQKLGNFYMGGLGCFFPYPGINQSVFSYLYSLASKVEGRKMSDLQVVKYWLGVQPGLSTWKSIWHSGIETQQKEIAPVDTVSPLLKWTDVQMLWVFSTDVVTKLTNAMLQRKSTMHGTAQEYEKSINKSSVLLHLYLLLGRVEGHLNI